MGFGLSRVAARRLGPRTGQGCPKGTAAGGRRALTRPQGRGHRSHPHETRKNLQSFTSATATISDDVGVSDHVRVEVSLDPQRQEDDVQTMSAYSETEIQEKALRVNHVERVCPLCNGTLSFTVRDVNSPGGRLTRACAQCDQQGRVWYREDLAPAPGRSLLVQPLTDKQLMALPDPA